MAKRLFLERRTYRRNRLQDAARLLPVLGLVLIFAPIFIRDTNAISGGGPATGLSQWLVYYFVIWLGLIVITAWVSRALVRSGAESDRGGSDALSGPQDTP